MAKTAVGSKEAQLRALRNVALSTPVRVPVKPVRMRPLRADIKRAPEIVARNVMPAVNMTATGQALADNLTGVDDGAALLSAAHPSNPTPGKRRRVKPSSLETVEIVLPNRTPAQFLAQIGAASFNEAERAVAFYKRHRARSKKSAKAYRKAKKVQA